MSIISQTYGLLGQDGINPRRNQLVVTDNLAAITAAGYLQNNSLNLDSIQPTDIFDIIYSYNVAARTGVYGEFIPSFNGSIITLVSPISYAQKGTGTEAAHAVTINDQAGVITTSSLTTAAGS